MAEQKQNNVELTDEEKEQRAKKRIRTIVAVVSVAVAVLIVAIVLLLLFVKRDPSQNEPIPAGHTHSYSSWVVVDEPTCTEEGLRERTCTCGEKETETLDPLGHTPGGAVRENKKAPTCTEKGSYEEVVSCTVCEEEVSRKTVTVDALGHTPGEAVKENEVAATCTSAGSYEEVVCCTVCGEELSRKTVEVAALGHDHKGKETQRVTCISSGEMTYTCTRCGDSYTEVVAPIDHAWGEPEWEWAEDYSSATATFICERGCGYQEVFTDREIASEETQHASCTQEGKFDHTASVTFNGNEYTDTVTQTTPFVHVTSEDGTYIMGNEHHWKLCTQCGAKVKEEHVFEDGAQNCSVCGVTDGQYFSFSEVSGGASVVQNGTPSFTTTAVLPEYYEAESEDMPITEIGKEAFYFNASLTEIVLPDSIISIGLDAFRETSITEIALPDSLTTIGEGAFQYGRALTSITIPANVTSIGRWAIHVCKSLQSVKILGSGKIGDYAFSGCDNLTSVEISTSITSIGENAFGGCQMLPSITIPDSVTSIGNRAFEGCYELTSITIPASVTSIGQRAFDMCRKLTSIIFEDTSSEWSISDGSTFTPSSAPAENARALTETYVECTWTKVTD